MMLTRDQHARSAFFATLPAILMLLSSTARAQASPVQVRPPAPEAIDSQTWFDEHYVAWLEKHSMLGQANALAAELRGSDLPWQHRYAQPQPREAVKAASVWLLNYPGSVITRPGESVIGAWAEPELWNALHEIGIDLLHTGPVRTAGGTEGYRRTPSVDGWFDRISLGVDPQLGTDDEYRRMVRVARKYGGFIAGDIVPLHTGKGPDFRLAERAYKTYPGMYVMIEIPEKDWELLPPVRGLWHSAPVSREAAEKLARKGYLPGLVNSNDATADALELSGWDATAEILGVDGKIRRWAYLHFFKPGQPTLNWLDPSATAQRVIAGDVVKTIHDLGAKVIRLDAVPFLGIEPGKDSTLTWHYQHPLSVWGTNYLSFITRRLGGWTFQELNVPLEQLKLYLKNGTDLSYDFFTRTQVVHCLLVGDATLLRQSVDWRNAFAAHEIVERLACADQMGLPIAQEHFRGQRLGVVVRAHHEPIRTGALDHEELADRSRRKPSRAYESAFRLGEDVARLAKRTADNHVLLRANGLTIGARDRHWMMCTVEDWARQVVETRIHKVEEVVRLPFDGADLGHQKTALGDQVASGLDLQGHAVAEPAFQALTRGVPLRVVSVQIDVGLARAVGDRQAAAGTDGPHAGAYFDGGLLHRRTDLRQVLQVGPRADVHVQSADHQSVLLRSPQAIGNLAVPDAMLRLVAAGVGLAAMAVAEARVDS